MKRALLSVTDKTGIVEFGRQLIDLGYELISTGGTAKTLQTAGLEVLEVAQVTDFPEMLDGRVKTLHPLVHGAILGDRRVESHVAQMERANMVPIDIVAVNLYAFEKTVLSPHTLDEAIESIDIGGPAMVRAAAKNWANVAVVVDPSDYQKVVDALKDGHIENIRLGLSAKAFRHTAAYDATISRYLSKSAGEEEFPEQLSIGLKRAATLRYGENSHQNAALYLDPLGQQGIARARQLWGKEMSYNNYLDADAAWELVCDLPEGSCAIIKHGNPCGVAHGRDRSESYRMARESDPVSAFGGIAAFNVHLDETTAQTLTEKGNFLEVVIAPSISPEAVQIFAERSGWGQNVRLLEAPKAPALSQLTARSIRGGYLVQDADEDPKSEWKIVTDAQPTEDQLKAMRFQWAVVQHVKSNGIVIGTSNRTLGIGAGQMNRVQSVRLAIEQAGADCQGAVLASDAFFPFADSILKAHEHGVAAIVQPGGSVKDQEVINACNERKIPMVLTNIRHFKH